MRQVKTYCHLKVSVWFLMLQTLLPRVWRSARTNKLIDLSTKSLERVDVGLDVKNLIDCQEDLKFLMLALMGKQRYWLFKHQRKRFVTLREPLGPKMFDKSDGSELLGMEIKDAFDRQLFQGIFTSEPILKNEEVVKKPRN